MQKKEIPLLFTSSCTQQHFFFNTWCSFIFNGTLITKNVPILWALFPQRGHKSDIHHLEHPFILAFFGKSLIIALKLVKAAPFAVVTRVGMCRGKVVVSKSQNTKLVFVLCAKIG